MKVNVAKIKKKLTDEREKSQKGRVTLYFNLKLYEDFQKACEKMGEPASGVIEEMMKDFLNG